MCIENKRKSLQCHLLSHYLILFLKASAIICFIFERFLVKVELKRKELGPFEDNFR